MRESKQIPKTLSLAEAQADLARLAVEVQRTQTPILLEEGGVPIVALVSPEDLARLQDFDRAWDEGTRALEQFSRAFADVPTAEAEAEVDRIIAEQRRRRAAKAERRTA